MNIDPLTINQLTEHEQRYKRINTVIIDAFGALHPPTLTKIGIILFNIIMETKRHCSNPNSKYYSEVENRRIYNSRYVSLEDLLDRCYPVKYGVEKKDMSTDISNIMKRIQDLEDMDIFYTWKYGSPYTYLFVMERDIGIWKYFNPIGFVTPKTLKKVVKCTNGMIDTMSRMEKSRGRTVVLKDIENSFLKDFLNNLILKMNPEISKLIPLWDGTQEIAIYLKSLRDSMEEMEDFEGQQYSDDFILRLPQHLRKKLNSNKTDESGEDMNIDQLSKDLVPESGDIIRNKSSKASLGKVAKGESIKAKRMPFDSIDPFADCNQLMKYYRDVIFTYNKNARFYPYDSERIPATQIMDMLIEKGKSGDKDFLKSWIRYYISSSLQGGNVYKREKTSLLNFKKTFSTYEGKYFRG